MPFDFTNVKRLTKVSVYQWIYLIHCVINEKKTTKTSNMLFYKENEFMMSLVQLVFKGLFLISFFQLTFTDLVHQT